jgi:hypothetical protein
MRTMHTPGAEKGEAWTSKIRRWLEISRDSRRNIDAAEVDERLGGSESRRVYLQARRQAKGREKVIIGDSTS